MRSFAKNILGDKVTLNNADEDQNGLLVEIMDFKKKTNPEKPKEKNVKKRYFSNFFSR